ncbi:aspartic peptidase domain-containing protein [Fusarium sp. MPI-SDFR-AT-0072]|nr:aspartic peptidase domain-containing protein [Fusarium sp. MPI-SDFR-AT-0072]
MWSIILGSYFLLVQLAQARDPAPVLLPSGGWTGSDGNWSTISFSLGSNSQAIEVLVSTALSEFWAIGPGGCLPKEPHCIAARGGIYNPQESSDWSPLGTWQLGLSYLGYDGNGNYGRDVISTQSPLSDDPYTMDGVLIATINTTNYLNGLFGLGITQSNFNGTVADSPLTQAVGTYGLIPSYSFGYTAGAYYRNTPVSLTLGGVETPRFKKHDNVFTLSQEDNLERPMVRGIQITPAEGQDVPSSWESQQPLLSQWNSSFFAIIDSSTPYLWLPDEACDQFAQALNLTYNSTFELYTISDDQYRDYTNDESFDLTFVLSSFDDNDNFGDPYSVPGIVNITIPLRAFVGLLQYPFMPDTIQYGDPAIPYFMLRKAKNSGSYILGRSFLQESYLITKYDEGVFSIHQALFPDEPSTNSELTAIEQSDNSPYPPPYAEDKHGLSDGQVIGIGVGVGLGVFVVCAAALFVWLYFRRKRKRAAKGNNPSAEDQDLTPNSGSRSPKSPLVILFSKILGRNYSTQQAEDGTNGREKVAEAPDTQIHEMSAPLPVAELDGDDGMSWNDDTEMGTDSTHNMTAYEIARRKLDKQLQGPVPTYTPPADGTEMPAEKAIYQPDPTNGPPVALQLSPSASLKTTQQGGTNTSSIPLPSPLTPGFDANGRPIEAPSPTTIPVSPTNDSISLPNSPLSPTSDHHTINSMAMGGTHSDREPHSPSNPSNELQQRAVQRTPIDPSKVVFLGALPKNTRFSRHAAPQIVSDEDYQATDESSHRHGSVDTLGSNFTVDEERRSAEGSSRRLDLGTNGSSVNAVIEDSPQNPSTDQPDITRSRERINPGEDLVHVPQLAERRYSWEQ